MTRLLGLGATGLALALAVYGVVIIYWGSRRNRTDLIRSGQAAAYATFGLMTVANLSMIYGLLTHDFSISYVAQVGSRATPPFYTVISLWGALEGSILFWGWVLSAYTASVVFAYRHERQGLVPAATGVMLFVGIFFYTLLIGPANPFGKVWPVPADGPGPNPLLQNHILMGVHPPLLYLGYVGMTVPFAFAIGAMITGRFDADWIKKTRIWTMTAWGFLSLAIVAGMWWSYDVLGWGGYWAWDPVENASFMPWLTATAFLHSVMVEERRGMLKVWNLSLIISTFLLTILGTFLTRSGILSSVHAFTEGTIGFWFLGFIAVVFIVALALLAGRAGELRSPGKLQSPASRETVFLLNNLLFTAFAFTVLLGTLFPLVAEAARGVKVSVGEPFFNRMTVPIMAALLFLIGVGPLLPWGRPDRKQITNRLLVPGIGLLAAVVLALLAGTRGFWSLLAFAFAGYALTANVGEFVRGAANRMRVNGENPVWALLRLVNSNRRRYGGYVAHIGIVIAAFGITASSTFRFEHETTLKPGESLQVGNFVVRLDRIWGQQEPQRFAVGADMAVLKGGRQIDTMEPRLNFYPTSSSPITTPAVRSTPRSDLYLTLMAFEQDGSSATVRAIVEPMVAWIWFGGLMVGLGALLGLTGWKRRTAPAPRRTVAGPRAEPVGTGS